MDLYLMNTNFELVRYIENYKSFIWTERYDSHGDFVLTFSLENSKPSDFPRKWYLLLEGSTELMIIRTSEITYDPEEGRMLEVTGQALTSLLDQRVVWNQTNLDTELSIAVRTLLNQNILNASVSARNISNLAWSTPPSNFPSVYQVEAQYHGESLYEAVSDLCEVFDVGFRITHPSRGNFRFQLFSGVNRSHEQNALSHVTFSPEYDNLDNARYFTSLEDYCNVVLVGGEGEGTNRITRTVNRSGESVSGVHRFEKYHSAERRSSNDKEISDAKYRAMLDQEGRKFLKEHRQKHVVEGEADPANSQGYGRSFNLGDIVQITDNQMIDSPARVVEYVRSNDDSEGYREYPTLRIKND